MDMFEQMGILNGFTVDDDSTGDAFNILSNLQQYDVVIFSNTSGNTILDSVQKANLTQYMNNNGSLIGIHSASDTYRHSTANGVNTGSWDWYPEILGASVQENPNHVTGTPVYRIDAINTHFLLTGVPDPWFKAEEYYYWEAGYFNNANVVLQEVEQTIGPNGTVNSYDSARAVTWYRILPGGNKIFYTSLGHDVSNFTSDLNFYTLLENAVLWTGNLASNVDNNAGKTSRKLYPNPATEQIFIAGDESQQPVEVKLFNIHGKPEGFWHHFPGTTGINLSAFSPGMYIVQIVSDKKIEWMKLMKK